MKNLKIKFASLPMLIPLIDCKLHKICPRVGMTSICPNTRRGIPMQVLLLKSGIFWKKMHYYRENI